MRRSLKLLSRAREMYREGERGERRKRENERARERVGEIHGASPPEVDRRVSLANLMKHHGALHSGTDAKLRNNTGVSTRIPPYSHTARVPAPPPSLPLLVPEARTHAPFRRRTRGSGPKVSGIW